MGEQANVLLENARLRSEVDRLKGDLDYADKRFSAILENQKRERFGLCLIALVGFAFACALVVTLYAIHYNEAMRRCLDNNSQEYCIETVW